MIKLLTSAALGLSVIATLALAPSTASANSAKSSFGLSIVIKDGHIQSFKQKRFGHVRFGQSRFDRRGRISHRVHPHNFARGQFHKPRFHRADRHSRFGGHRSRRGNTFIFLKR